MKRILSLLFVCLLLGLTVLPACAKTENTYFIDEVGVLSDAKARSLENRLEELSEKYKVTVAVVIVSDTNRNVTSFADDYYDYVGMKEKGWRKDGILLLYATDINRVAVSTTGKGQKVMSESALDRVGNRAVPLLKAGKTESGIDTFLSLCEEDLETYFRFPLMQYLLIAFVLGLIVALIVTSVMKSKLKSVKTQKAADGYMVPGSLQMSVQSDRFLYRTVHRTARPRSSSSSGGSHRSSSGRSHGGRSW